MYFNSVFAVLLLVPAVNASMKDVKSRKYLDGLLNSYQAIVTLEPLMNEFNDLKEADRMALSKASNAEDYKESLETAFKFAKLSKTDIETFELINKLKQEGLLDQKYELFDGSGRQFLFQRLSSLNNAEYFIKRFKLESDPDAKGSKVDPKTEERLGESWFSFLEGLYGNEIGQEKDVKEVLIGAITNANHPYIFAFIGAEPYEGDEVKDKPSKITMQASPGVILTYHLHSATTITEITKTDQSGFYVREDALSFFRKTCPKFMPHVEVKEGLNPAATDAQIRRENLQFSLKDKLKGKQDFKSLLLPVPAEGSCEAKVILFAEAFNKSIESIAKGGNDTHDLNVLLAGAYYHRNVMNLVYVHQWLVEEIKKVQAATSSK